VREEHGVVARELDAAAREVVWRAITDHCAHAGWHLIALNVRTNHVHCVLAATDHTPEVIMGQLKAWATRRLREAGLRGEDERVWTREGSTRHLFDEKALASAIAYVVDGQGKDLD
jgi:REP element-mobilizing transposase RayT